MKGEQQKVNALLSYMDRIIQNKKDFTEMVSKPFALPNMEILDDYSVCIELIDKKDEAPEAIKTQPVPIKND